MNDKDKAIKTLTEIEAFCDSEVGRESIIMAEDNGLIPACKAAQDAYMNVSRFCKMLRHELEDSSHLD